SHQATRRLRRLWSTRKARHELCSTSATSWATTKSVGMWNLQGNPSVRSSRWGAWFGAGELVYSRAVAAVVSPAWLQRGHVMHDTDEAHDHFDLSALGPDAILEDIEGLEMFTLKSVGIDIGSSTSHLVFSRLTLRREGAALSGRFKVTNREVLYRSQIM